jgi:hypothetical protein
VSDDSLTWDGIAARMIEEACTNFKQPITTNHAALVTTTTQSPNCLLEARSQIRHVLVESRKSEE